MNLTTKLYVGIIILIIIFFIFFHRCPIRRSLSPGIVSPADGKIIDIEDLGDTNKISIYLNLFNVHVQYMPAEGKIISKKYGEKSHFDVSLMHEIDTKYGLITVIQKTGYLVHRLVSFVDVGKTYAQSDRLGMIRFGSRVEIILPKSVTIVVKKNDKLRGGETLIAH